MFQPVFLVVALLSSCSGESSVNKETVVALAGQDVVLPCSFSTTATNDFPGVEWSKEGLQPYVVFLYRDGCETHEMKHPDFHYRTSFITSELKNRNISLRISNVQLADAGKYQCMRLWKNKDTPRDTTTVELVVGSVSEPKLSVVSVTGGRVTLQCEANCWLPEPEIQFLDNEGNNMTAGDTERHQEASGCFTVTRTVTPQDATGRVTCRVHQVGTNQSRDTEILVPVACTSSLSLSTGVAILEAVLLLSGFVAVLLWQRRARSAKRSALKSHSSDQSVASAADESEFFLQRVTVISVENAPDQLRRRVAQLEKSLRDSEETIRQLLSRHQPVICSPTSAKRSRPEASPEDPAPMPSSSNPEPVSPRMLRLNSLPNVLSLSHGASLGSSTAKGSMKKHNSVCRSVSDSQAHSGPNVAALLRRHSSVLPSIPSNRRFSYLHDLKEESEQLICENRKS